MLVSRVNRPIRAAWRTRAATWALALVTASLLWSGAAVAQVVAPIPVAPANAAVVPLGAPLALGIAAPATERAFPQIRISTSPAVDATGTLAGPDVIVDLNATTEPAPGLFVGVLPDASRAITSELLRRPGRYFWQGVRLGVPELGGRSLAGPVSSFVLARAGSEHPSAAPDQVGARNTASFLVNATANLPPGVSSERWLALAIRSGQRWGLTFAGTTTQAPVSGDALNVVGFSSELPPGALGLHLRRPTPVAVPGPAVCSTVTRPVRRRVRVGSRTRLVAVTRPVAVRFVHRHREVRRYRDSAGRLRSRIVVVPHRHTRIRRVPVTRRVRVCSPGAPTSTVIDERDIRFLSPAPWQQGSDYPTLSQYDLESTVLHEFGHMAGIEGIEGHYTDRCADHPLTLDSAPGEWWRSGSDRFRFGCPS